ncbi:MAG: serine hydrolase [Bacteroidetes bacterium]|nr:serine hydrolase [Bacteroidota bacterium]
MKHLKIAVFSAFLLLLKFSIAQTGIAVFQLKKSDSLIQNFVNAHSIPGASVAITKKGNLVYNRSFGYSNIARTDSLRPYHKFRIASISKPITSIAIFKLIDMGLLTLADTVFGSNKIITDTYYLNAISDNRIFSITIKQLLEHTAGWDRTQPCDTFSFCDPLSFPLHVTASLGEPNPVGDSTLIKFTLQKGLNYTPGSTFAYSNMGYLILGKVIEKISGKKYIDFLQTELFDQLGICDIELGNTILPKEREVQYEAYDSTLSCYGTNQKVPWQYGGWNLEAMNSHGGLIATAEDLVKLIVAVDSYTTFPDILTSQSILQMRTPSTTNPFYAKGWEVNPANNWWHTGSLDGTASFIARTSGEYTWSILLNARPYSSPNFWNDLDALPWNCINTTTVWPTHNFFSPSINVSSIATLPVSGTSAKIKWINGNGTGRLLICSEDSLVKTYPQSGMFYYASDTFGNGFQFSPNTFAVYTGSKDSVILKNLNPTKNYFIQAFEYSQNTITGNKIIYKISCAENATFNLLGASSNNHLSSTNYLVYISENYLTVKLNKHPTPVHIRIYDQQGCVVMDTEIRNSENNYTLIDYKTGIYFVELLDKSNVRYVKKIFLSN